MVMKNRFMSGWVTYTGPPASICFLNSGTTLPRLPSTLPKRTMTKALPVALAAARTSRSATRFEAPIMLVGLTALSVEIRTNRAAAGGAARLDDVLRADDVVGDRLFGVLFHERHVLVRRRVEHDLGLHPVEDPEDTALCRECRR